MGVSRPGEQAKESGRARAGKRVSLWLGRWRPLGAEWEAGRREARAALAHRLVRSVLGRPWAGLDSSVGSDGEGLAWSGGAMGTRGSPRASGRSPFPSDLGDGPGQRRTELGRAQAGEGSLSRLLDTCWKSPADEGSRCRFWARRESPQGGAAIPDLGRPWPGLMGGVGRAHNSLPGLCFQSRPFCLDVVSWVVSWAYGQGRAACQADQVIRIWLPFLPLHPRAIPQGPQALLRRVVFPSLSHCRSEGTHHHRGTGELQPGPWVPEM